MSKTPTPFEVMLFLVGVVVSQLLVGPFLLHLMGPIYGTISAQLLLLLLPGVLFLLGGRFDLSKSLPLQPLTLSGAASGVLLGLSLWLPALLTVSIVGSWLPEDNFVKVSDQIGGLVQQTNSALGWTGTLFAFAVIPGVVEEFLLRGIVLPSFLRKFRTWVAIFCSALIFAILHGNIPQGAATLAIGYLLGVAVTRSGSLWISMIAHATHNAVILLVTLFVVPNLDLTKPEEVPPTVSLLPLFALLLMWSAFRLLPTKEQWWDHSSIQRLDDLLHKLHKLHKTTDME
jgi:membrane protease YdiL (CAAX protease family)